jgi:hypothetical protein
MASDDDVPIGEGARNYYEQQFGSRIEKISAGAARSKPAPSSSNWGGRGVGGGIAVAVFILIRVVIGLSSANKSSHTSYPTIPQPQPAVDPKFFDELARMERQRAEMMQNQLLIPPGVDVAAFLLNQDEVPLPAGLCYRIWQESDLPRPSPGKRIWSFLDEEGRTLVRRSAGGAVLNPQELAALLGELNRILQRQDFHDEASFSAVNLPLPLRATSRDWKRPGRVKPPHEVAQFNRGLLEAAYPAQIVPWEHGLLEDKARDEWRDRARRDLEAARRQFGRKG